MVVGVLRRAMRLAGTMQMLEAASARCLAAVT
jgi:hypothetical protein